MDSAVSAQVQDAREISDLQISDLHSSSHATTLDEVLFGAELHVNKAKMNLGSFEKRSKLERENGDT